MTRFLLLLACLMALPALAQERIASLHPLLSDMARQIAPASVEVVDLMPRGGSLHSFAPNTRQMARAAGARFILACGKKVEPYLPELRQALAGSPSQILELGEAIPDVYVPGSRQADPHWWNSPVNMVLASQTLAQALCKAYPEQAEAIQRQQRIYAQKMQELERQARLAFSRIPAPQRILVTEHAAMCHFCQRFGFIPIPIFGIAAESEGDMASLAQLLQQLRQRRIGCIYTEPTANSKILDNMAKELGARVLPLNMDGLDPKLTRYEDIFRHNVQQISEGLCPPASTP